LWLLWKGFVLVRGKMSGHLQYEREGVKITVPGHGPPDLTKKHVALILRARVATGFDRVRVLQELRGARSKRACWGRCSARP